MSGALLTLINRFLFLKAQMQLRNSHIFREGNSVADCLANIACVTHENALFNQHNIPRNILGLHDADKFSVPCFRFQ